MVAKYSRLKPIRKAADCPIVGVAVTITPKRNTHAGIIYKDIDDHPRLLHLAFHQDLQDVPFDPTEYLCADPQFEHNEDAEAVAAHCRLIAERPKMADIKFAIHYNPKARIRASSGNTTLVLYEGKGLNCSTFVLAVFSHAGPALVDFSGWQPRPEDIKWQKQLLEFLKKCGVPASYWKKVAKDRRATRRGMGWL